MKNTIPKLRKKASRYKGNVKFYAVVRLNGRDFILGVYGSPESQQKYEKLVGEWLSNGRQIPASFDLADSQPISQQSTECVSVTEVCIDYVRHSQANLHSASDVDNIKRVLRELRLTVSDLPAEEFTDKELIAFRKRLLRHGITPKNPKAKAKTLSRYVVNKYCGHIVRMFRHAAKETNKVPVANYQAIAAVSPLSKRDLLGRETHPIRPVEESVIEATCRHLAPMFADMAQLQLLTGMRPGEVCSMKYADIRRSGSTWLFMPTNHKTAHLGEDRLIYVGKEAQAILIKYDYRPPEDFCFSPADRLRQGGREPVIGGRKVGDRYHTRTYRQAIWRACDKAGIDRWAPNRIRKTNANNVRRVGGLEAAQVVLGHKSRTTTEKFYADIDTSKAIEVMEKIG